MIENVERVDNVLYIKLSNSITPNDVNLVGPLLKKLAVECENAKMFVYMNGKIQYNFSSLLALFLLYFKYKESLKHVAIISNDLKSKKNMKTFCNFFPCNVRFFDYLKYIDARDWIVQV